MESEKKKLLITGAVYNDKSFFEKIKNLGFDICFLQDEKSNPKDFGINPSEIYGVICNALFLYNDIALFSRLRFIQLTSAGLDRVPIDYIKRTGIKLYNASGVYSIPMAEYAVCGVLQIYKQSNAFRISQRDKEWKKQRNVLELFGKTVCVVGCGSVGTECAKRFKAFGCKVIGLDVIDFERVGFDEIKFITEYASVFNVSDVIILTLPLTKETEYFVDKVKLSEMKKSSILVNIARGKIINEKDLIDALKTNRIGGAVLDVFEEEPLNKDSVLWDIDNVIITPHNSFVGNGNKQRLKDLIIKNILK